jgi:hypothetical protein
LQVGKSSQKLTNIAYLTCDKIMSVVETWKEELGNQEIFAAK